MPILVPNWPQPKNVVAVSTLRNCNLSTLQLPPTIIWLQQQHDKEILYINDSNCLNNNFIADGSYTNRTNIACVVKTADCLPILVTNVSGNFVAALHAGWRGLANGILANFLHHINTIKLDYAELIFWLGPAIGPNQFEVGIDVVERFDFHLYKTAFNPVPAKSNKFLADLYKLASLNLQHYGIRLEQIYSHYLCTKSDPARFYSYRLQPQETGRMHSIIWIKPS